MKTENIREITTETDLRDNRLRQVSEAQKALAARDFDLATQHLWNIMSTVERDSAPRKEMEQALARVRQHHVEREKLRDKTTSEMRILEASDFNIGFSASIEMVTCQELYDDLMDVLIRWELLRKE